MAPDSSLTSVCLSLHALGPSTLAAVQLDTGIPLPVLRAHLHNLRGERYGSRLSTIGGIPERVWFLLPPQSAEEDCDILIVPEDDDE